MPISHTIVETYRIFLLRLQKSLSWGGLALMLLCLMIVLVHYIFSTFQPVRWPNKIYFFLALFFALGSRKWSTFFVLFSLPLLPELHMQAEYIFRPAVKYFISYPSIDVIAGFCLGQWTRLLLIEKQPLRTAFCPPPWPLGLLALVLLGSVAIAIARNLLLTDQAFTAFELINSAIRFKFLNRTDNYFPLADLIIYNFCGLLIVNLLYVYRETQLKDELIFIPVLAGLLASGLLGLFQALTSWGLPTNTYSYRPDSFGFGAQGFQPDLHAFAGHMLIGTVGVLGFIIRSRSSKVRIVATSISVVCWTALILSKSRASFMLAVMASLALFVYLMLNYPMRKLHRFFAIGVFIAGILCFAALTNNLNWIGKVYEDLTVANFSNFGDLNVIFRSRVETHGAAMRMGFEYPFYGIGQGNFFRLSSIFEFSRSTYMVQMKGENAHNYFLQTFAEVGIVGILCFALAFLYPILKTKPYKVQIPALIAIVSIFLGNLFSHSLITRENLFLLAGFLALLYALEENSNRSESSGLRNQPNSYGVLIKDGMLFIGVSLLVCVTTFEVLSSFHRFPFVPK
jgi:hypothetical protein